MGETAASGTGRSEVIKVISRNGLAVLTYDQHASVVFTAHQHPLTYLTTLPRKLTLLAEMGVDVAYVVNFTSALAKLAPADFVEQYMIGLRATAVVAGFDHTYGASDAQSDMSHLPGYAAGRFDVIEVSRRDVQARTPSCSLPVVESEMLLTP